MFYSAEIFRTSSLGGNISSNPERTALRRRGGKPDNIGVLQQRTGSLNIRRLLLKQTRYPKLRNLVLFYAWEEARVWAHWNHSFDRHLSSLGPISHVVTSWVSSGLPVGNGCSLMAARWQVFFPSWVSSGVASSMSGSGCNCWWLWHPLFTDVAGNIPFLTYDAIEIKGVDGSPKKWQKVE